jgi:hypothetical protein
MSPRDLMWLQIAGAALVAHWAPPAAADPGVPEWLCATDRATDATYCFKHRELTEAAGERTAPLYRGGPRQLHSTGHTAHALCAARTLYLRDRDGVKYAAGPFAATELSQQLGTNLCNVPLKRARKP